MASSYTDLERGPLASLFSPLPGPPDGGVYGWGAAAATFIAVGTCVALEGCYGQLAAAVIEDRAFGASRAFLSWVISFQVFMELALGVPVAHAVLRFGPRAVVAAGGALLGTGMFLSAGASSPAEFFFFYALLSGTGLACVYGAASMALGYYFNRNAAAAASLSGAGAGVMQIFFSQLIESLTTRSGWRATVRAVAVLSGVLCVLSAAAYVPVGPAPAEEEKEEEGTSTAAAGAPQLPASDSPASSSGAGAMPAAAAAAPAPAKEAEQAAAARLQQSPHPSPHLDSPTALRIRAPPAAAAAVAATPSDASIGQAPSPLLLASSASLPPTAAAGGAAPPSPAALLPAPLPPGRQPSPLLLGLRGTPTASARISAASVAALNLEGGNTPRLGARSRLGGGSAGGSGGAGGEAAAGAAAQRASPLTRGAGGAAPPLPPLPPRPPTSSAAPVPAAAAALAPAHAVAAAAAAEPPGALATAAPPPEAAAAAPHLYASPQFWSIALCMAFHVSAATIPEVHLGTYIGEAGLPSRVASACYSLMGVAGLLARLLLGLLALRYDMNMLLLLQFVVVALGVAMMGLAAHGGSEAYLYLYSLVAGAACNVSISCVSPVLLVLFGAEALPSALGATYSLRAPAVLLAAPLAAMAVDALQGYAVVWSLGGVLCCLSALPVCLVHIKCRPRAAGQG